MSAALRTLLPILALLAGALAAVAGEPVPPLAADEVSALQLAEWIHARRSGLVLLDTRPPGAMALARLPAATPAAEFTGNADTVVLYGDDHLRQRPTLHGSARRVLALHGGMAAWNAEVLYPVIRADAPAREKREFAKRARLSRYFGGTPRVLDPGARATRTRSRGGC